MPRTWKARPSVRRRFNDPVLEAVYIRDRKIGRPELCEVFAPVLSPEFASQADCRRGPCERHAFSAVGSLAAQSMAQSGAGWAEPALFLGR